MHNTLETKFTEHKKNNEILFKYINNIWQFIKKRQNKTIQIDKNLKKNTS